MADFFESDEVTKSYDGAIMRRILSYVRPYRALLAISALSLVLTTVGELLLPVIVQKTVDEALVVSWSAIDEAALGDPRLHGLGSLDGAPRAAGRVFVRDRELAALPEAARGSLASDGLLDAAPYYVTPVANVDSGGLPARVADWPESGSLEALLESDGYVVAPLGLARTLPPAEARALRGADAAYVRRAGAVILVALVVILVATFLQTWSTSLIGQKVMKALRMDLFRRTSSQSLAFLSRQPVGRLVTRLTGDVETINEFFTSVVVSFIKDASVMAGALVVLFFMSPRLALVAVLTLPPVLVGTSISRKKARDAFRQQRTWTSRVNSFISEHVSGVAVVKLFGKEAASARAFEAKDAELMKASLAEMYVFAVFRPVIELFSSVSTAIVLWFGAGLHSGGLITLGTLMAFVNLIRMFYSPLQDISEKFTILQSAMAGGERVFTLLDADERVPDRPSAAMPAKVTGRIEFEHVWFAYKGEDWVLRDLSFVVEPGETLALVGYTGAGKSTVSALIARLWDPQKGRILLDGIPVKDLPLAGLRSAIRPVMQDVFLFSGTVGYNIELGLGLPAGEVEAAARAVKADGFIERLPGRYDERLGEGAATLSSGQRQLLSFARVVAHDPDVVVLDEATSSIDTETERLLQEGLSGLMRGRTTVAIAHRLSTIRHADRILVLADGHIVEQGDHDSLIAHRGIYYNLYKLQYEQEASVDR